MLASGPFRLRKPLLNDVWDLPPPLRGRARRGLRTGGSAHGVGAPLHIVYNAGTRVLFLYPEVPVIKDEDLSMHPQGDNLYGYGSHNTFSGLFQPRFGPTYSHN